MMTVPQRSGFTVARHCAKIRLHLRIVEKQQGRPLSSEAGGGVPLAAARSSFTEGTSSALSGTFSTCGRRDLIWRDWLIQFAAVIVARRRSEKYF